MLKNYFKIFFSFFMLPIGLQAMQLIDLDLDSPLRSRYFEEMRQLESTEGLLEVDLFKVESVEENQEIELVIKKETALDPIGDFSSNREVSQPRSFCKKVLPLYQAHGLPSLKFLATQAVIASGQEGASMPGELKSYVAVYKLGIEGSKLSEESVQSLPSDFVVKGIATSNFLSKKIENKKHGMNALLFALNNEDDDSFGALVEDLSVDPNVGDDDGITPLMLAAHLGKDYYVECLLRRSSLDLDKVDCFGRTAVMHASQGGHGALAALLIRHGANTNIRDIAQNTLHDLAENSQTALSLLGALASEGVQMRLASKRDVASSFDFLVQRK